MNRRRENGMAVELEEFTEWRHGVEARLGRLEVVSDGHVDKINIQRGSLDAIHSDLGEIRAHFGRQKGMLQALHLTQNEHSTALRELRTGQEVLRRDLTEVRRDLTEVRRDLTEVRVGVQTIIDLLASADDERSAGGSPS
jgi:chromosome segregation ATPase